MPKIEPYKGQTVVRVGKGDPDPKTRNARWWLVDNQRELASSLFGVVKFLKENQAWRQRQAATFARMYSNLPIWNYLGMNMTKMNAQYRFPNDRPTMNVVQSCTDALVSRLTQSRPKPMFLTSGGDYKKRKLAKDLNRFIDGEFYQCKAYQLGEQVLRDSIIIGDGLLKVIETSDCRVGLERTLSTEVFVDDADGMYGSPQQMHQLKIVDRDVAAEMFPEKRSLIENAEPAYFDSSAQSTETIASQIMLCESWHLRSGVNAKDGRHVIAVTTGTCLDEDYDNDYFPFEKIPYSPRMLGYWAQGLPEQLMGTQNEINRLLYTIQTALNLCAVPKWLVEDGSKIVSAHINNQIGGIVRYQGTPPVLQTFQVLPQELYAQLERLVQYAFQQSGISQMAAASQKPAGLDSGKALREYDDLQSDRFAYLSQRQQHFYIELGKKMFEKARQIAKRDGKYETIYPGKDSIEAIGFPKEALNGDDDFIMQAFPVSSYSKNPAERKQEIVEDMQAGLIEPQEGRRLLDFPDLQQEDQLTFAPEERILKILDEIVEEGKYSPPDPFMDLGMAKKKSIQYYNKFTQMGLEEAKADMLRTFSAQIDLMQQTAMAAMAPPPMGGAPGGAPQAVPAAPPVSPMLPNSPQ